MRHKAQGELLWDGGVGGGGNVQKGRHKPRGEHVEIKRETESERATKRREMEHRLFSLLWVTEYREQSAESMSSGKEPKLERSFTCAVYPAATAL